MGELVLRDSSGEFLLVHAGAEFLSLARRPDAKGDVPLVRFAPEHGALVGAAIEAALADEGAGPLDVVAGPDEVRVEVVSRPGGRRVRVANLRRVMGDGQSEALELDAAVAAETVEALRGPRLRRLTAPRADAVFADRRGHSAAVEQRAGATVVSARTARVRARAEFPPHLRRVVAACVAMVVGNPGERAVRVAALRQGPAAVLVERVATATGDVPFTIANARPGRPARPGRTVRLSEEMAAFVVRCLASDDDLTALGPGTAEGPAPPPSAQRALPDMP